jgi:pimeloyl-ACP methyl ester carboxylesterase
MTSPAASITALRATTRQQRSVDGIDVFIEGDGPHTLLMIHGWPDTYRLWDAQVAQLRAQFRCVRFTLPGFDIAKPRRALSLAQMVDIFKAIADAVAPGEKLTLLLHDWGCVYGYEFAARHPQLVARVIGVDIGDHNSGALRKSLPARAKWAIFSYQIWLALAWMIGGAIGTWMTRYMARAMRCRSDPAFIGAQMNYPYHVAWFRSHGSFRGAVRVEPFSPMLYIYGQRKPFMFHSRRWLDKIAAMPGCAAHGLDTGHWVMSQKPAEFNQLVSDWLAHTALAPASGA